MLSESPEAPTSHINVKGHYLHPFKAEIFTVAAKLKANTATEVVA